MSTGTDTVTGRATGTATGRAATADRTGAGASRLRLTRRGRAVVTLCAGAIAVGGLVTAQSAVAGGPQGAVPVQAHVVAPGDTVWQIAADLAGPGEDVRDVVATIDHLNGLDGAALQVGQRLVVPTE